MNQTEREILNKILLDLFLDGPRRGTQQPQQSNAASSQKQVSTSAKNRKPRGKKNGSLS